MAATTVSMPCAVLRDSESLGPKILPLKTGWGDASDMDHDMSTATKWRSEDGFCMRRVPTVNLPTLLRCWSDLFGISRGNDDLKSHELLGLRELASFLHNDPPPSYIESQADTLPEYAQIDPSIYPRANCTSPPFFNRADTHAQDLTFKLLDEESIINSMTVPVIDFDDSSNFRQAPSRKEKKAQNAANKCKWADADDEGNKGGADGAEDGGGGGGSNNGDGAAGGAGGDGGGGGDDWGDDWNAPSKKKKVRKGKAVDEEEKKKKKEEEEQKKKKEEEEQKKKEEDDAANGGSLNWANGGDTNANNEWGGFTPTAKKGKKNKKDKDKVEPEPTTTKDPSMGGFDEINLGETPQLDLSFGETGTKDTGSGFGFGGWGNSWNTSNKWGFGTTDTGATDTTKDTKDTSVDTGEADTWSSFGGNKKNKEKTTTTSSGFDFGDLGTLDESKGLIATAEADEWGGSGPGKREKKNKKKGAFDDTGTEPDNFGIGTAVKEPAADDSWNTWGATNTKVKKKGKKDQAENIAPVPPPPPSAPAEVDWGAIGSDPKKDKKKGKKGAFEDDHKASAVVVVPEADADADAGWDTFETKKDKKKGKKNQVEEKLEDAAIVAVPENESEPEGDLGWGSFGTSRNEKDKKKGKKGALEEPTGEPVVVPEPEPKADLGWGTSGTSKKDKEKRKGKKGVTEECHDEPAAKAVPVPEPEADADWGFGSKKDKEKAKKGKKGEPAKEKPIATVVPEPESTLDTGLGPFGSKKEKDKKGKKKSDDTTADYVLKVDEHDPVPGVDDSFSSWETTTKSNKKGKKDLIAEVKEDPITVVDSAAAAEAPTADDDWMNWDSTDKKKDKKGKKGAAADTKNDDALPSPRPPLPAAPEPSTADIWGSGKKDKKGKKGAVTDKAKDDIITVPNPVEEDFGGWGLSSKDKKQKEKEKKEKEEKEKREREEKENEEKEKEEAKPGKKGKSGTPAKPSKTEDLMVDSVPDISPVVKDDSWGAGMWGSSSKTKKKGGKNAVPNIPPPVPTPPAQGLTPEPEDIAGLDDFDNDDWASLAPAKTTGKAFKATTKSTKVEDKKAAKKGIKGREDDALADLLLDTVIEEPKKKGSPKEESAAKVAKGFWGGIGTTSTLKSKSAKDKDTEKEKGDKTAKDLFGLDDLDDEIIGIVDEPPKKGSKTKTDTKLGKSGSKDSKDSDKPSKALGDKKKKADDAFMDDLLELGDEGAAPEQTEEKKDDAWSFWGSAKKPGGIKADEGKKEITKAEMTNQKSSLKAGVKKEPEATTAAADEALSQPFKASKSTMSAAKGTKASSVLQRVKDLEKEGKAKGKPTEAETPLSEPELEPLPPPKKSGTANKSKTTAAASNSASASAKKKETSSPVDTAKDKKTPTTVPGTFPGAFPGDDDIVDVVDLFPDDKKASKKSARSKKKNTVMDELDFDAFAPEAPPAPPTPPPEPAVSKPPVKKERAKVVKDESASSWGFWGAPPKKEAKKESKSKDDADVVPSKPKDKTPAPGLSRSKSTRTAKEKDKEVEKSSKSSGSDEKEKKSASRPTTKSRGSSFGGFFGGPPPVRAKTVRRSSNAASKTASSRRDSMDIDGVGLPSPPADEAPEMSAKAAKLMGAGAGKLDRKASTKGKQKPKGSDLEPPIWDGIVEADPHHTAVPDPYPIDDDDMVMVGGLGDADVGDAPPATKTPAKKEKSKSRSKKEVIESRPPLRQISSLPVRSRSRYHSRGAWVKANVAPKQTKPVDDFAEDVVMVEAGSPQDDLEGAKENLAFDERPRIQRANTSAKKSKGGMMGIFGGFGKTRRASETFERPKSKGVLTDDEGLSRRKRPVAGNDDSAKRLRREDRKVRRSTKDERAAEGYVYDAPATNDADEADAQARKEERRARRREAERTEDDSRKAKARSARDQRARKEEEAESIRLEEKRVRRAAREEMNAKLGTEPSSRPKKSDRRRSHMDPPILAADEDAERRAKREARRAARTPGERSKKKSVDDYFDPRNGGGGDPYMNGNDHTSSWVKSQLSDPADPPPLEPTVIEPPPVLGGGSDPADDEAARRAKRKSRRSSRYVDGAAEDEDRRRRKEREIRSSEGSREDDGARPYSSRRKSDMSGLKSFEARPALAAGGKRGSWFKKMGL